jgi:hypothetical protein
MEKIKKSFSLSLIGFNESQTRTFSAILSLAERGLRDSWSLIESVEADFFFLYAEKSESESLICSKNLPRERCLFASQKDNSVEEYDDDELFITSNGLPQLSALVKMLNYQTATVTSGAQSSTDSLSITAITVPNKIIALSDDDFFDPNRSFLISLLQTKVDFLVCRFKSPTGIVSLYINFVKKTYHCEISLKELGAYFIEDLVVIEVLVAEEWYEAVKKSTLPVRPLADLIWYVAFVLSNGQLLSGHSNQDNVHLTRWPYLGAEVCDKYIKLSAFMRNNVASLTVTANKTNIPLTDVYSFYNACYLIGIVEKADNSELYAKVIDTEKQQLLAKITNRLKAINNQKEQTK